MFSQPLLTLLLLTLPLAAQLTLTPSISEDGTTFYETFTTEPGRGYVIEQSGDMQSWSPLSWTWRYGVGQEVTQALMTFPDGDPEGETGDPNYIPPSVGVTFLYRTLSPRYYEVLEAAAEHVGGEDPLFEGQTDEYFWFVEKKNPAQAGLQIISARRNAAVGGLALSFLQKGGNPELDQEALHREVKEVLGAEIKETIVPEYVGMDLGKRLSPEDVVRFLDRYLK